MGPLSFEYRRGGIWFPHLRLWLDATKSQRDGARVFVSHAHSDHTARHREIIATAATVRFMEARLGGGASRVEHVRPWREACVFRTDGVEWRLSLFPAGHIYGSAMALIEAGDDSVLYTGDFKLEASPASELCEPVPARQLIMETTFGRPRYVFPSRDQVAAQVVAFCEGTLNEGRMPVLLGYALGKAQELAALVLAAGLPVAVHPRVARIMDVYRDCGGVLPPGDLAVAPVAERRVLLCPPGSDWHALVPPGIETRAAVATGWAMDPGARFRYRADAAFPLSDHADYPQLLAMVERVGPRKVFTLHGYASEFAARLRERGWDAAALSEPDQLEFAWDAVRSRGTPAGRGVARTRNPGSD